MPTAREAAGAPGQPQVGAVGIAPCLERGPR